MTLREATPAEQSQLAVSRCPACKGQKWFEGPRGGCCQNFECANVECGMKVNFCGAPDSGFIHAEILWEPQGYESSKVLPHVPQPRPSQRFALMPIQIPAFTLVVLLISIWYFATH